MLFNYFFLAKAVYTQEAQYMYYGNHHLKMIENKEVIK